MLNTFQQYINKNNIANHSQKILLAVSGGADSVAMLDLFVHSGFKIAISHINFHLRGEDSNNDEKFVRSLAEFYKVDIFVKNFDTKLFASQNHLSIEMAARQLRYAEFNKIMDKYGFEYTAVAHHLDDAIETFMLNLLRGTGISGLTGMHIKNGRIIRPMLCFTRKQIENYIIDNNLHYVTDKTNFETEFARNKIRNCIIPYFEQINPSFRNSFDNTFNYLKQVKNIYFDEIEQQKSSIVTQQQGFTTISINKLLQYPHRKALLFELLHPYGFNTQQITQIDNTLNAESGKIFLTNNYQLVKDRNSLIIRKLDEISKSQTPIIIQETDINSSEFKCGNLILKFEILEHTQIPLKCDKNTAIFDYDTLKFPLKIRHWQQGDTFVPFGKKQPKKISDLFIDNKLSIYQKETTYLLCTDSILWVIGLRTSNHCIVTAKTRKMLKIIAVI